MGGVHGDRPMNTAYRLLWRGIIGMMIGIVLVPGSVSAQDRDSLYMRVVDVGPGLCVLTLIPPETFFVYDAGHWQGGRCLAAAQELAPAGDVHLMVLSHSDGDHVGDGAEILGAFDVHQIIHTGSVREDAGNWRAMMDSLAVEVRHHQASARSLATVPIVPGEKIDLGDATLTLVAGWHEWPEPGLSEAEARNVISIVARLDYAGRSVLLTGDAIGRRLNDPSEACKDAEAIMVERHRSHVVSLASDVLVAPHHGGNNASSQCFLDAIDPLWVVYSAGHDHGHPTAGAVERVREEDVPLERIFRTDLGDDEGDEDEWRDGAIEGCIDPRGDDDVELVIREDGTMRVGYVNEASGC